MFLNLLNEKEGKNFLELAKIAMMVNGIAKESEMVVFKTFRTELGLPDYELKGKELDPIITEFQSSTKRAKKVVMLELGGMLDADEEFDDNEKAWFNKVGSQLGFRESELKKMMRWVFDFNDLVGEAITFINNR